MVPALEIYMKSNCRMECSKKKKKKNAQKYICDHIYVYIHISWYIIHY